MLTEFRTALRLALMAHRRPEYQEAGRWLAAADSALIVARGFSDPSMEGRLELDRVYRDARELVEGMETEGHAPRRSPAAVPLGFRDLRDPALDAHELLRRLGGAAGAATVTGEEGAAGPRPDRAGPAPRMR